jgi:hypothetical protein
LEFPSLYLELFVIRALSGRSTATLADNVFHVLKELGTSLPSARVDDPSNTNNVLSDDLTLQEKQVIAGNAIQSTGQSTWETILW